MTVDYRRTLDEIEGVDWGPTTDDSHLVVTCQRLRSTPLREFTAGDLRLMLLQRISVPILAPLAIALLSADPLLEATYYPGDLLHAFIHAHESRNLAISYDAVAMLRAARAELERRAVFPNAERALPDARQGMMASIDALLTGPHA